MTEAEKAMQNLAFQIVRQEQRLDTVREEIASLGEIAIQVALHGQQIEGLPDLKTRVALHAQMIEGLPDLKTKVALHEQQLSGYTKLWDWLRVFVSGIVGGVVVFIITQYIQHK